MPSKSIAYFAVLCSTCDILKLTNISPLQHQHAQCVRGCEDRAVRAAHTASGVCRGCFEADSFGITVMAAVVAVVCWWGKLWLAGGAAEFPLRSRLTVKHGIKSGCDASQSQVTQYNAPILGRA